MRELLAVEDLKGEKKKNSMLIFQKLIKQNIAN